MSYPDELKTLDPSDARLDLAMTRFPRRFTFDFATLELKVKAMRAAAEYNVALGSLISCAVYDFLAALDNPDYLPADKPRLVNAWRVGEGRRKKDPDRNIDLEARKTAFNRRRSGAPRELPSWEMILLIIKNLEGGSLPVGQWRFVQPDELDTLFKQAPECPGLLRAVYVDELGNLFDKEFASWRWYSAVSGSWEAPRDKGRLIFDAIKSGKWYPRNAYWEGWEHVEQGTYWAKVLYGPDGLLRPELLQEGVTVMDLFKPHVEINDDTE